MDLTEEKVSFDQMPQVVSELKQEISGLKTLIHTLIKTSADEPKDGWMNIEEFRAYHPDHPAKPTIYEWVGKKLIPVHKDGKKLRFRKSEIDEWLNGGRAKTRKELDQEALEYVQSQRLGSSHYGTSRLRGYTTTSSRYEL